MSKPTALIITGYGINCEEETAYAFELAGATPLIIHVQDLIHAPTKLGDAQIVVLPGGFSFGDDTGAGRALANLMRAKLQDQLVSFIQHDKLVLGICNGFQVLVNLGLLPALYDSYGLTQVALVANDQPRYLDRWVDVAVTSASPWLQGLKKLSLPIAHGEGKFYAEATMLHQLQKTHQIALRYTNGELGTHFGYSANPNGSLDDIAGITDGSGRVLGLMPHPERAVFFTQLPHWTWLKEQSKREKKPIPVEGPGLKLCQNAVAYGA